MIYESKWMLVLSVLSVAMWSTVPVLAQGVVQPVKVVNSSSQPVPTTAQGTTTVAGTVNVGNTPNVNVANTPSVNIANSPTVTLESGASVNVTSPLDSSGNPIPIATQEAVQLYGSTCEIQFGGAGTGTCELTAIPQGKQLAIQEFDAAGYVETGNRPQLIALDHTITTSNFFSYIFMGTTNNGFDAVVTHQETHVYVAPGATPECYVGLLQNSNGVYVCDISGFLTNVPLGSSPVVAAPTQHKVPKLPFGRNLGAR